MFQLKKSLIKPVHVIGILLDHHVSDYIAACLKDLFTGKFVPRLGLLQQIVCSLRFGSCQDQDGTNGNILIIGNICIQFIQQILRMGIQVVDDLRR